MIKNKVLIQRLRRKRILISPTICKRFLMEPSLTLLVLGYKGADGLTDLYCLTVSNDL